MGRQEVQWRELISLDPEARKDKLNRIGDESRGQLLEQALAHADVLVAQGHRTAARRWLMIGAEVAEGEPDLVYRLERKRIRWLESEGLQEEAMLAMRALFERYRRSRTKPLRAAELCMELGIVLDRQGHKAEALKLFRNAIARYGRLNHPYNKAAALFNTASVLYDLGRVNESIKVCLKSLQEGGSGHLELETHVTLQMANSYESKRDLASAREWYRYAAEGYRRLSNRKQESDILYRLGWMALRREQFEEAALFLERALKLKREYDYGVGLARYHVHQAETARSVGLHAQARQHYYSCLGLALALGEETMATRARFGLFQLDKNSDRYLPGYLRKAPERDDRVEASIERGRNGVYSEQQGEGFRTGLWRQSGGSDTPVVDRTFLARLLDDLSKVWQRNATDGHEALHRQGKEVMQWQSRSRKGPRS